MGLKKIEAKQAELAKKYESLVKFKKLGQKFAELHAQLAQAHRDVEVAQENILKRKAEIEARIKNDRGKVANLDAHGVKEFEEFKNQMLKAYDGQAGTPAVSKLDDGLRREQRAVDDMVRAWAEKLAVKLPKVIAPGMVFMDKKSRSLLEITAVNPPENGFDTVVIGGAKVPDRRFKVKWANMRPGPPGFNVISLRTLANGFVLVNT